MAQQRHGLWPRPLHRWRWTSSALCLIGMPLPAATGLTLNHPTRIEATPQARHRTMQLPASLLQRLHAQGEGDAPLPRPLAAWLQRALELRLGRRSVEWSDTEVYLALPGPGGDAWLSIDRGSGAVEYESTERGGVSCCNDLHKGRNAGPAWGCFIDLFAVA